MLASARQSTGGPLEPAPSARVEIGSERSALLHNGDISARVTARWSSTGENALKVRYRNSGRVLQKVAIDALQMAHPTGDPVLRTAVDATGVDRRPRQELSRAGDEGVAHRLPMARQRKSVKAALHALMSQHSKRRPPAPDVDRGGTRGVPPRVAYLSVDAGKSEQRLLRRQHRCRNIMQTAGKPSYEYRRVQSRGLSAS